MKLATWNVNSIRARLVLLLDWLGRQQPDLVCLQETKVIDELFPTTQLAEIGYIAAFAGGRAYNGVAILSRQPLQDVRAEWPLTDNPDYRLISGLYEGLRVYSAYFPNGRDPTSEHFITKLRWIDALRERISPALAERVVGADIDVAERRKPSASDHAPVIVELD